MFSLIQARGYRSLKMVDQTVSEFQALVGPNASGKTTFLDVIDLLGDITRNRGDVSSVIRKRSSSFEKLLWLGAGDYFQFAVEAKIPESVRTQMSHEKRNFTHVRYEIEIGIDRGANEIGVNHETLWLASQKPVVSKQAEMFPREIDSPRSLLLRPGQGVKTLLKKQSGGNDNYYPEGRKSYAPSFRAGRARTALSNVPADREVFPVSTWFKEYLETGIQSMVLNSHAMRQPSPPGLGLEFNTDGTNLPWVIENLRKSEGIFSEWLDHVRTALDDVRDIRTIEREEDRHRYIVIEYANGAVVPSWLVSDGTLRLLALTIPAYLNQFTGVLLIEEPENGIHPKAMETVIQSLCSIYDAQVLMATHSPIALGMLESDQVLCFAKNNEGATDIVLGSCHPALRKWKKGEPDFGVLFASGILS